MCSGVQWCVSRGIKPANKARARFPHNFNLFSEPFLFSFTDIITNGIMAASILNHCDTFSEILRQQHFDPFRRAACVCAGVLNIYNDQNEISGGYASSIMSNESCDARKRQFLEAKKSVKGGENKEIWQGGSKTDCETKRLLHLIEYSRVQAFTQIFITEMHCQTVPFNAITTCGNRDIFFYLYFLSEESFWEFLWEKQEQAMWDEMVKARISSGKWHFFTLFCQIDYC